MNDMHSWLLAGVEGAVLGTIFFGGLWWTVRKGASSGRPALWFFSSGLLRMAIVVAGFYYAGDGRWRCFASAVAGFVVARLVVVWLARSSRQDQRQPTRESGHAS